MATWMSNGSTGTYYQTNGTVTGHSSVYVPRPLPDGPASFQYLSLPDGHGMLVLCIGTEIVATICRLDQPVSGYYLSWRGGNPLYEYSLESLLETLSGLFDSADTAAWSHRVTIAGGGGAGGSGGNGYCKTLGGVSISIQDYVGAPTTAVAKAVKDALGY